jgi:peptidoglycan hydrolase-like protein with peptidoglycan-binding domain
VVDGIYGPATEAAVRKYQKDNDYQQNGAVGPTLQRIMGIDSVSSTGEGSAPVATSKTGSELLMPEGAQLWYNSDTKQWMVIFKVPPVEKPDGTMTEELIVSWTVESDEDLEGIMPEGTDASAARVLTEKELTAMGVVNFGGVDELRNFEDIEGSPIDTWEEDMSVLAISQPWILDEEWQRLSMMAVMERDDGQLTQAEIQSTKWWRNASDNERRWMEVSNGDPATAAQWRADSRNATVLKLRAAGIDNAPEWLVDYMADKVTTGEWSKEQLDFQIKAVSDPYSNIDPDEGLLAEMRAKNYAPDATQEKEDTVRTLLNRWLGPAYGDWNDKQIAAKAGDLRNNPDAEMEFIESLKDQRVAMFPGTDDRNTSYQDLAAPWRSFSYGAWGQDLDEKDTFFQTLIKNNDAAVNGRLLQEEGMKRNVGKVLNDTKSAMTEAWGGTIYG